MTRFMLDTNMVSQFVRGQPSVLDRVTGAVMSDLCLSAITQGELLFGLARRPEAIRLHRLVREFLIRVEVVDWDAPAAERYGALRADMERRGKSLGTLDLLIAAHAVSLGAVLVTNDRGFAQVEGLRCEDWVAD